MRTILKSQMIRLVITFIFVFFLLLAFLIKIGRASAPHQTIPTAPPTTAVIPTRLPTETPTKPPQPTEISTQTTVISTQPTRIIPSQTTTSTARPTIENTIANPSLTPNTTEPSGTGTINVSTVTHTPIEGILISGTSSMLPTTIAPLTTIPKGSSGILYYLLGGGIIIIVIIGIVWIVKFRRK